MLKRILGRTGLTVSVIGFGGIPIQRVSVEDAVRIIRRALQLGVNFIDTARVYTDSELKIGLALKNYDNKCVVASKSRALTKLEMENDIKLSLSNLNLKQIHLYQLHNVSDFESYNRALQPDGAITALKEAQETGLIKYIGITSHVHALLKKVLDSGLFDTIQFPFNPLETDGLELIRLAKDYNIGTIIMKPLAGGAFYNAGAALKWILQHDVSVIIPGMDSIQQVEYNLSIIDSPLTAEELKALKQELKMIDKRVCRRCEYCQPCPQGIKIPVILLLDAYYQRYRLPGWAKERYKSLVDVTPEKCTECGLCEEKCPYKLPIRKLIREAHRRLAS
ncbi:MAG: aldo/keto reductase [Candidatus Odinarchaeum yellowstonii]|uniref:Aldo/keto reductase n=1 Tax=Odinarchaeota yellowstonii (strain LCB_4) TaxID=1841599 RepID=A0AAF0IBM2_ODILC|nr:MAG: aldo/keto reductase [Candidatus Odinarchaeum yellowstonii]